MAVYQIYQFDAVALPLYNPEASHDAGPTDGTLMPSIGGVFDVYGSRRRLPTIQRITVSGIYAVPDTPYVFLVDHAGVYIVDHQGDYQITGTAQGYLRRQVDAIRAKQGVRGTLWRRRWDDTAISQWKTARLLNVRESGSAEQRAHYARVDLEFETAHAAWRASAAATASKTLVSGGSVGLNVTAGGNTPVTDAILTITASGTITSLAIKALHAGIDLRWTGTLASGQALVFDAGAQSVVSSVGDAYSGFALGSGHTAQGWLPLAEGITPLIVESDGPGTAAASWYDQWI